MGMGRDITSPFGVDAGSGNLSSSPVLFYEARCKTGRGTWKQHGLDGLWFVVWFFLVFDS